MNINQELVEKVKAGTHCIEMPKPQCKDDVALLNVVLTKAKKNLSIKPGLWNYYWVNGYGDLSDGFIPIPLSSFFLPTLKMIPVEELEKLVKENTYSDGVDKVVFISELQTLINKYK